MSTPLHNVMHVWHIVCMECVCGQPIVMKAIVFQIEGLSYKTSAPSSVTCYALKCHFKDLCPFYFTFPFNPNWGPTGPLSCHLSLARFWCLFVSKKMPNNAVMPQRLIALIILVNSHQRWKQMWNRVCFHLWCELTLALLRYHSIAWSLFFLSWNKI